MSNSLSTSVIRRAAVGAVTCLIFGLAAAPVLHGQSAENVAVVVNDNNAESRRIADHYVRVRGLPPSNVLRIQTSSDDAIERDTYVRSIEQPLGLAIRRAGLQDRLLYLVLTKGIPLRIVGTTGLSGTLGSVDSELTLLYRHLVGQSNTMQSFQTHEVVRTASVVEGSGKPLFELLKCQQCHVLGTIPKDQPTSNLAPDLRMSPERLQPEWIKAWLKKPSDIVPGTRMPAFWPDYPKSFYPQLGGDAEAQITAIRDYLMTFRGGPSPKTGAKSANN